MRTTETCVALVLFSVACCTPAASAGGGWEAGQPSPSISVSARMEKDQVSPGESPRMDLTVTNLSDRTVVMCDWDPECLVHVDAENGEAPTTLRQRTVTGRLLPGEAPDSTTLSRTLYIPWEIAPGESSTHKWDLKYFYDLSAPGKYTGYFLVKDPVTASMLRTNPVSFEVRPKPGS